MTTRADAGDDLLRILDELDELVSTARSLPMSSSAIVGRQEALDLIDRAREAVPTAVHRAEEIVADADAVLAQGREESQRILNHAQEEAERLVAGENIVRMANDRADAIISTAEERAARLRHGADDYSDRSLAALQAEIDKLAEQVQAGRDALAARLETAANDAADAEREQQEANRHFAGWSVDPAATRNWSKGGR
ncbi:MAG: ATPase [Actinomyces succiniciruminis]|uniref:ATPase subunit H n=1 Tax=Actinomyces succiniciruminis TaxID=1522002 RepID=A0A1L7RD95_9ACTO|nr:ATPase [Actinomyces succiniciruminis]MBE6475806.1 ATP synthase F0 subunit B [Actinomyces succiniciruminis]MBM6978514.1 ATPase [Actinomyces succiniciruminis]CED91965.1 ATPase subunit H [Actinomyces succiniciruminis]